MKKLLLVLAMVGGAVPAFAQTGDIWSPGYVWNAAANRGSDVWFDRLARSLKDLLQIIEQIETSKCAFRSLTEAIDTTTPVGKLMLNILGSFAEFERGLIRERAIAGQAAAYSRGIRWGGQPKSVNDLDAACAYLCYKTGDFTIPLLAQMFDCSQSSIWRIIWRKDKPNATSVRRDAPAVRAYLGTQISR